MLVKVLYSCLFLMMFVSSSSASEIHLKVSYSLLFSPPHHEPVVNNRVARYRSVLTPKLTTSYFEYEVDSTIWALQRWRNSKIVGHGFEAWRNSDWTVEEYKVAFTHRFSVPIVESKVQAYVEYYLPWNRHSWRGKGYLSNYYMLVGLKGEFEVF